MKDQNKSSRRNTAKRSSKTDQEIDRLDQLDRAIIRLLQEDGRRSNADIARLVAASEQTVKNRIEKLITNATISVRAFVNNEKLGLHRDAVICLRVKQGALKQVGKKLAALDFVSYVGYVLGRHDIMIEVVVANDEQLYKVISEDLQAITEIDSIETWTVMRIEKSNFSWATQLFRTTPEPDASNSPGSKQ
jgi:Lrp/AsnC family transcriptional regulator, regulator for asnA, asnC and gidA